MTTGQKVLKYLVTGLAVLLCVSIFAGIISVVADLFEENTLEEMKDYTPAGNLPVGDSAKLRLEIGAARLTVVYGERFSVESNLKKLSVKMEKDTLKIEEEGNARGGDIRLTLPYETTFGEIDLEVGAGEVRAEGLSARTIHLEMGAGDITVDRMYASGKAKIEGGAGDLTVAGGEIANLDMDMGVGNTSVTAKLTGSCDLDMGVGDCNLTLLGAKENYSVSVDKGIGKVTLDGAGVSDGVFGTGSTWVELDCGVGNVRIAFRSE